MNAQTYFITGTDTGAGKTVASVMLMRAFRNAGHVVYGMKPVASGCVRSPSGLVSEDALQLMAGCSVGLPYAQVNPVALEAACSPNIAALIENRQIDPDRLEQSCRQLMDLGGTLIIEGIGGWRTPVFGLAGMEVLVARLHLPVILVVGLRLGCINHALLTLETLRNDGVELAGWIVSQTDPDYISGEQTVSLLREAFGCAPLGHIPHLHSMDKNIDHAWLNIERLLKV